MKKPAKKTPKPNHGKQHPLHAKTLDHFAEAMMDAHYFVLAAIFRGEAKHVRRILC